MSPDPDGRGLMVTSTITLQSMCTVHSYQWQRERERKRDVTVVEGNYRVIYTFQYHLFMDLVVVVVDGVIPHNLFVRPMYASMA